MKRIVVNPQKMAELRVKAGYSQNSLAKESDTSSALISRLEAGTSNPRPSSAAKICRALNLNFDELFTYSEQEGVQ